MKEINKKKMSKMWKIIIISISSIMLLFILSLFLVPSGCQISPRAARKAAQSNARIIITSTYESNVLFENGEAEYHIIWEYDENSKVMLLNEKEGTILDSIDIYNETSAIEIRGMTDENFSIALEYLIITDNGEIEVNKKYDHTKKD